MILIFISWYYLGNRFVPSPQTIFSRDKRQRGVQNILVWLLIFSSPQLKSQETSIYWFSKQFIAESRIVSLIECQRNRIEIMASKMILKFSHLIFNLMINGYYIYNLKIHSGNGITLTLNAVA